LCEIAQEFLDLAFGEQPTQYYQSGDVEIAMGWTTVDEVLRPRLGPEPLIDVLTRLRQRLGELAFAVSTEREKDTRAKVEAASKARGAEFMRRLQGNT
jgi:hypothetical protein